MVIEARRLRVRLRILALLQGAEHVLVDRAVRRQLKLVEIELEEESHRLLCPVQESGMHHYFYLICDVAVEAEHLLEDRNGLLSDVQHLLRLMVSEGAAPDKQPAMEDIALEAFLIKLGLYHMFSLHLLPLVSLFLCLFKIFLAELVEF